MGARNTPPRAVTLPDEKNEEVKKARLTRPPPPADQDGDEGDACAAPPFACIAPPPSMEVADTTMLPPLPAPPAGALTDAGMPPSELTEPSTVKRSRLRMTRPPPRPAPSTPPPLPIPAATLPVHSGSDQLPTDAFTAKKYRPLQHRSVESLVHGKTPPPPPWEPPLKAAALPAPGPYRNPRPSVDMAAPISTINEVAVIEIVLA